MVAWRRLAHTAKVTVLELLAHARPTRGCKGGSEEGRVGRQSGEWEKGGQRLEGIEGGRQYHSYPTHLQIPHLSQWNTPVSPSAVLFLSQNRHTEQKYSPNATPHFVHELDTGWR